LNRGGCRCGELRLVAVGEPDTVVYCHCGDCRRSSGAPVSLFAGYPGGRVEVERGAPKIYESAPGVRRSFCGDCGTPMFYEDERLPGEIYISIGVFDAPESLEPRGHSWFSRRLPWLDIRDDLPRHETSSHPR
jgi:hypothetical protein